MRTEKNNPITKQYIHIILYIEIYLGEPNKINCAAIETKKSTIKAILIFLFPFVLTLLINLIYYHIHVGDYNDSNNGKENTDKVRNDVNKSKGSHSNYSNHGFKVCKYNS